MRGAHPLCNGRQRAVETGSRKFVEPRQPRRRKCDSGITLPGSAIICPSGGRHSVTGVQLIMFATIYLPNFYLQATTRHQPELRAKPLGLIEEQERKPVIIQLNEAAETVGVRKGMTPSQALARCLSVVIKARAQMQEKS